MSDYAYGNAHEEECERLARIERRRDPHTIRFLEALGVGTGWRCLEVGAGAGSIAAWLCERVGANGHVVATDIDPRFLVGYAHPNLEVRRHDLAVDPLEENAFDLVHARLVLMHLAEPEAALDRLVRALQPGGWALLEENDDLTFVPDGGADPALAALFEKVRRAFGRRRAGSFGRQLYRAMLGAGLTEIGSEGLAYLVRGGSSDALQPCSNLERMRDEFVRLGYLTEAEVERYLAALADPGVVWMSQMLVSAWGQRPG